MVAANKDDHIFVGCTFVFVNILLSWFSPSCRANETLKCDKTCIKKPSCSYFFKLNRSLILAWGNDFGIKQNYRNVSFPVKTHNAYLKEFLRDLLKVKFPCRIGKEELNPSRNQTGFDFFVTTTSITNNLWVMAFGVTSCGSSNLEEFLPFSAIFEQNISLEHI